MAHFIQQAEQLGEAVFAPQGVKARAEFLQLGGQILFGFFACVVAGIAAGEVLEISAFNFGDDVGQTLEGLHGLLGTLDGLAAARASTRMAVEQMSSSPADRAASVTSTI